MCPEFVEGILERSQQQTRLGLVKENKLGLMLRAESAKAFIAEDIKEWVLSQKGTEVPEAKCDAKDWTLCQKGTKSKGGKQGQHRKMRYD